MINGLGQPDDIERVLAELEHDFPLSRVVYNGANLMKGDEAAGLVEQTIAGFGRVDILVNNAGIQHVSPIETSRPKSTKRSSRSTCRPPGTPRAPRSRR